LDFSATGFEWQMLPLLIFTKSDRWLFLLSWLPFLLLPGLLFPALRLLGVNGRSARRWMWLLPAGFCYAVQCSGLQNDGYTVNYTLSVILFSGLAFHRRHVVFLWLALLGIALLVGAKLSNLPLLLPFGLLLLPALLTVSWLNARTLVIILLAAGCSFLPLAYLCWQHTGDWTGDPTDQWNVHPHNAAGALVANTLGLINDGLQPPVFPAARKFDHLIEPLNQLPFMRWLRWAQPNSEGFVFGEVAYEGSAGLGCGLACYFFVLLCGVWRIRPLPRVRVDQPWFWRWVPLAAWFSFAFMLCQLGSTHVTRYGASYYPLLLASVLVLPRVAAWERKKISGWIAALAMLAAVVVILLTPARPALPVAWLARVLPGHTLQSTAAKYHYWAAMRDDLAPLRAQIPPEVKQLGYAGGFKDTAYGLWKPFGSRTLLELGLPLRSHRPPPADLAYAVVNDNGLRDRYDQTLAEWLAATHGTVVFAFDRNNSLTSSDPARYDHWYLVRFTR
jgi:hypothetical protein